MSLRSAVASVLCLGAVVFGSQACALPRALLGPTPTPPPGWRVLLSEILLDDDELPVGWARNRDWPRGWDTDPRINHVYRDWWNAARGTSGSVDQHIWRAYAEEDAEDKYGDLRETEFGRPRPREGELYLTYIPPVGFEYASSTTNESHFACGWYVVSECVFIARYRNYVTEIHFDMEDDYFGHISHGSTLQEAEGIIRATDAVFADFLARLDATEVPREP